VFKGFSQCCDATVVPELDGEPAKVRRPAPMHINRRVSRYPDAVGIRVIVAKGTTPNSRWPSMGIEVQDYVHGFGANRNQFRLSPYLGDADHETEWTDIGGPYLPGTQTFNQAWWDENRKLAYHWGTLGGSTEVNYDSWWLKFCQNNGVQNCAWSEADVRAFGNTVTPTHLAFLDKMVEEFGCQGHVTWGVGNEEALLRGSKSEFYARLAEEFRLAEQRHPCKSSSGPVVVVHMISNNAPEWAGRGAYDIATTHERAPLTGPIFGTRPSELNEFNPGWEPAEWFANYCRSQAAGVSTWLWRNGSSDQELEEMLSLMARGCGSVPEMCFVPAADDPKWGANIACAGRMKPELDEAKAIVGQRCGVPTEQMYQTNALLAGEIRKMSDRATGKPICASGPWSDATAIYDSVANQTEEWHAVAYTTGCYSGQSSPKFCWLYDGAPPQPPTTSCDIDPGKISRIDCKLHQATNSVHDCTPKVGGVPVLPEGDPRRSACEEKAGGGFPTFWLDPSSDLTLSLVPLENPYQWRLKGSGSGIVHCTLPNTAPTDVCRSFPVSR
jgi:hypothetical protein